MCLSDVPGAAIAVLHNGKHAPKIPWPQVRMWQMSPHSPKLQTRGAVVVPHVPQGCPALPQAAESWGIHRDQAQRFTWAAFALLLKFLLVNIKHPSVGSPQLHSNYRTKLVLRGVPGCYSNHLYLKRHHFLPFSPNYVYLSCACLQEVMQDGEGSTKSHSPLPQ